MLFRSSTFTTVKQGIEDTIKNYEPRATIVDVAVNVYADQNSYNVSLIFYVGNNTSPTAVNLILKRAR